MKVQETYRISKKLKKKRNSPCNMMTKTRNVPKKERILEVARKKERRACTDVLQTL